jgi:hypothetical protein
MSQFWVAWDSTTKPITRYPSVRFFNEYTRSLHTVTLYDEFLRNSAYQTGNAYVFPVLLPLGTYTIVVSTVPGQWRAVKVHKFTNVCSAIIRLNPASVATSELSAGNIDVTLIEVGSTQCAESNHAALNKQVTSTDASEGIVRKVPFTEVIQSGGPTITQACPDAVRATQHREVREMCKLGQAPQLSAAEAQFSYPKGMTTLLGCKISDVW